MFYKTTRHRLPGYKDTSTGTIEVYYVFPDGVQGDRHPNPGVPYDGTVRKAFLPDNDEGRHVLSLLTKAFQLGLTFTVGESRTTGCANVVTWNDIHHKTSYRGGSEKYVDRRKNFGKGKRFRLLVSVIPIQRISTGKTKERNRHLTFDSFRVQQELAAKGIH